MTVFDLSPTCRRLNELGFSSDRPAISISRSITDLGLVCLFDGTVRRNLSPYLKAKYGIDVDEYRAYWKLPDDYPSSIYGTRADLSTCVYAPPPAVRLYA